MSNEYELRRVKITDIKVGKRFRKDYDINDEFLASVREKGVIQPVTLNKNLELMAGGRRYTAAAILQLPDLPALVRYTDTELDLREVELIENLHRKEMSWVERAELTDRIHELKKEADPSWTLQETADTLDKAVGTIHKDLQLAEALKAMPELKNVKNEKDVKKLLAKLEHDKNIKTLREEQKKKVRSGGMTLIERGEAHFQICDAFEGLESYIETRKQLDSPSIVTFMEVDPPYGIDLNEVKKTEGAKHESTHLGKYHEVQRDEYPSFLKRLCGLLYEAAAKDAWIIFWYGPTWHGEVLSALEESGFVVDDIPGIWVKGTEDSEGSGQTNAPSLYLARAYEPFFIARKGRPSIQKQGRSNVFNFPALPHTQKYHPTQKPIGLLEEIIDTFAPPNSFCIIPFLGSGVTLRAAYRKHLNAWGFELNEHNKEHFLLSLEGDMKNEEE